MPDKKAAARFTIQFSQKDPTHIQAANILNGIGRRGKAQYIANAVLYYESGGVSGMKHMAPIDEKHIEAAVNRILLSRYDKAGLPLAADPLGQDRKPPEPVDDIVFEDTIENFEADGVNAITNAMDMFRKKR